MNRMLRFLGLTIAGTLLLPMAAFAAKPISVYKSMVVPLPRIYANQGFFYSMHLGILRSNSIEYYPEIDGKEKSQESIGLPETFADVDAGQIIGGTIGFRYERWRPELELSWLNSKIRAVRFPPPGYKSSPRDNGDLRVIAVLANVYWDFHWANGINPFIGAGVGFGITNYDATVVNDGTGLADAISMSQSGFNLAYQFMAGVGYMFTDHVEADFLLKFFQTKLDGFTIDEGLIETGPAAGQGQEVKFDPLTYDAVVFQVEFRYVPS